MQQMEQIEQWLFSILLVQILILLLEHLFYRTSFEKYIHFFTEFFLILCLISPIFTVTNNGVFWQKEYWTRLIEQEWNTWKQEADTFFEINRMQEQYQRAYERQITQFAKECGLSVARVKTTIHEKRQRIERIDILLQNVSKNEEEEKINDFRNMLMAFYSLQENHIYITIWE